VFADSIARRYSGYAWPQTRHAAPVRVDSSTPNFTPIWKEKIRERGWKEKDESVKEMGMNRLGGWQGKESAGGEGSTGIILKLLITLSGNSFRQTVHTHCASVHQAAKLVAALLRVAAVTAGLAESNGSLPPGL